MTDPTADTLRTALAHRVARVLRAQGRDEDTLRVVLWRPGYGYPVGRRWCCQIVDCAHDTGLKPSRTDPHAWGGTPAEAAFAAWGGFVEGLRADVTRAEADVHAAVQRATAALAVLHVAREVRDD